ncbi:MAG: hypothetical protein J6C08_01870 [Campylobacter sp.]|uniref:hypothetical protein n=1 Tax=Campylobacter sp. TaxID=205 RepID=UPI001B07ED06|nr:hypothetical protein [Campylobacter sp.]MBO5063242.1 hypothetical protein [Campylobacter sp.]
MFKKVGRDIKDIQAENFINSTSDKETNDNTTKEKIIRIVFKIPKEVRKNIRKMIKGTVYLKKYYPLILKNDLTYFSDEDIMNIYMTAKLQNISMRDYVRIKLKLTKPQEVQFITYPAERDLVIEQIELDKIDKDIITQKARNLNTPVTHYGCIKMTAYCELTPALLFSQLELELLKEEAKKNNLSLKEYLSKKINEEL